MASLVNSKIQAIKKRLEQVNSDIERMEKDNSAGLLSPLEKMQLNTFMQEKKELTAKLRELSF